MPWNYVGQGYDAPITNMLDVNGDETEDPKEAAVIVAFLHEGEWLATWCRPDEIVKRSVQ